MHTMYVHYLAIEPLNITFVVVDCNNNYEPISALLSVICMQIGADNNAKKPKIRNLTAQFSGSTTPAGAFNFIIKTVKSMCMCSTILFEL